MLRSIRWVLRIEVREPLLQSSLQWLQRWCWRAKAPRQVGQLLGLGLLELLHRRRCSLIQSRLLLHGDLATRPADVGRLLRSPELSPLAAGNLCHGC